MPGVSSSRARTISSTVRVVTEPAATGPSPVAIGPDDVPWRAWQVVRRVLLRRNIVIDAETARLAGAAVQAVLQAGAPSGSRAGRQRAAGGSSVTFRFRYSLSCSDPPRPRTRRSRLPYLQPGDLD